MNAVLRTAAALALGLLLVPAAVGTASAAPEGRISNIEPDDGKITALFSASGLSPTGSIDPDTAVLTIEGQEAKTSAKLAEEAGEDVQRTIVLTIDTSASLRAAGLAAAKAASLEFIRSAPPDVRIGLVTFDAAVAEQVPPTLDRGQLTRAVEGLDLAGGTALYDAVGVALDSLGTEGARSMLLMSDGGDQSSSTSLAEVVEQVQGSGVTVDVVALGEDAQQNRQPLEQIAAAGGDGTVLDADDAEGLAQRFAAAAQTLNTQILVTAEVPAQFADQAVEVEISAQADGVTVSDRSTVSVGAAAAEPRTLPARSGFLLNRTTLTAALVGLFLGLAGILAVAALTVGRSRGERSTFRRRLSIYTLTGRAPQKEQESATALGSSAVARSAVDLAGKVVQKRDLETRLTAKLEAAGLPLRAAEWLLIHAGTAVFAGLVGLLISGGGLLVTVGLFALGVLGPFMFLSFKEGARKKAFLAQLPEVLQLMAGSLAAGYSLPQAIDSVVREGQEPIAGEFGRALIEARLGVPPEDALDSVGNRMQSKDFQWVVMAIRIQREVGGNLAELLRTVADTLREREFLRRHVRALSAEGRLSAWILGSLPPGFGLVLMVLRPEYISPLITNPLGLAMIAVGVVLLAVGVFWMSRIIKVEV